MGHLPQPTLRRFFKYLSVVLNVSENFPMDLELELTEAFRFLPLAAPYSFLKNRNS